MRTETLTMTIIDDNLMATLTAQAQTSPPAAPAPQLPRKQHICLAAHADRHPTWKDSRDGVYLLTVDAERGRDQAKSFFFRDKQDAGDRS